MLNLTIQRRSIDKLPLSDESKARIVCTNWSAIYEIALVKQV